MIPPSFIFPWFDRTADAADERSSTHARKPWLAGGREMHYLVALLAVAAALNA